MSLAAKIRYLLGYYEPGMLGFRRTKNDNGTYAEGGEYFVASWPTANPPTIAEIEAVQLPAEPVLRHVAPYDFQSRFTDAELVAIQTSIDPLIIRGRTMLQTIITYIDLDLQQTQDLIGYMALIGLIQPYRVAEILA